MVPTDKCVLTVFWLDIAREPQEDHVTTAEQMALVTLRYCSSSVPALLVVIISVNALSLV